MSGALLQIDFHAGTSYLRMSETVKSLNRSRTLLKVISLICKYMSGALLQIDFHAGTSSPFHVLVNHKRFAH